MKLVLNALEKELQPVLPAQELFIFSVSSVYPHAQMDSTPTVEHINVVPVTQVA